MFTIIRKEELAQETFLFEIEAPRLAKSALPGQFLIVKMTDKSERIPLTISDYDIEKGTIVIVFKAIGKSTRQMAEYNEGDKFADVVLYIDNMYMHGLSDLDIKEVPKRKRTMIRNLKQFSDWIMQHPDYTSAFFPIGDGLLICLKR